MVCCGPGDGETKEMVRMMVKPAMAKRTNPECEDRDVRFLDICGCGGGWWFSPTI